MNDKYRVLRHVIEQFSAEWELTDEEYARNFSTLLNLNEGYTEKLRSEIIEALTDPQWSWVTVANETSFIGSDDNEENVWLAVKTLIWDVIFPGQEPFSKE